MSTMCFRAFDTTLAFQSSFPGNSTQSLHVLLLTRVRQERKAAHSHLAMGVPLWLRNLQISHGRHALGTGFVLSLGQKPQREYSRLRIRPLYSGTGTQVCGPDRFLSEHRKVPCAEARVARWS